MSQCLEDENGKISLNCDYVKRNTKFNFSKSVGIPLDKLGKESSKGNINSNQNIIAFQLRYSSILRNTNTVYIKNSNYKSNIFNNNPNF